MLQILFVAIAISGFAHILSDLKQKWSLTYIFKPLTILIIIVMVIFYSDLEIAYIQWVLFGLLFSLLGDIFLMLRPQKFIPGLISFLIAHLFYIYAFWQSLQGNDIYWLAMFVLPIGGIYLLILWKHLGKYRWPVVAYFIAISSMLYLAVALFLVEMSIMASYALLGAVLFAISDGILAWRKFVKPVKYGQLYVMTSYYTAQCLIALSAVYY